MHSIFTIILALFLFIGNAYSQTPKTFTSSELLLQMKKLKVTGTVLYIAAHPDDENTRLLAYLANEKLYRTGYLSVTRGDGGQNLIGDEQGVDLGLIRTQELLAARRIDGAEQFFTRAYDFGYSKSPEETLNTWGHDKILSDVVWVIRKFRPDILICRFPTTGEGGHGHHTASAILAGEAFSAAADPKQFPEQFQYGVTIWQPKRLLWNTFNFGSTNTQREDQFKVDVGAYNPLLGKSYGEIAALSRSQHKSQGFGVPAQRGSQWEYFSAIKGPAPVNDLMEDVPLDWNLVKAPEINASIDQLVKDYLPSAPALSVPALVKLHAKVAALPYSAITENKLNDIKQLIRHCSGIFLEAVSSTAYVVPGDSLKLSFYLNNRSGIDLRSATILHPEFIDTMLVKPANQQSVKQRQLWIKDQVDFYEPTQPYWLIKPMDKGSFNVADPVQIGNAESKPYSVSVTLDISGQLFVYEEPVFYKFTDPVKGEIYQPVFVLPPVVFKPQQKMIVGNKGESVQTQVDIKAYAKTLLKVPEPDLLAGRRAVTIPERYELYVGGDRNIALAKGETQVVPLTVKQGTHSIGANQFMHEHHTISYDHIPVIHYLTPAQVTYHPVAVKIAGSRVGYIVGAGDKVPEALQQMGYNVDVLKEEDISNRNLAQYDAIITGVRAYNTNDWMYKVYDELMAYVKQGGVLLVQYNTSNQLGTVKTEIGPFPFTITRNRITDETAAVTFLQMNHPFFNFPNKITSTDFEEWIQERSIYHAETTDTNYVKLLSMNDPGEKAADGSLITANYGKGRFIYTGISFFRELPAGVTGAYRLFANLIAKPIR
jgi:LmbE family N-acetylglucosaminyl deacetylase